MKVAFLGMGLMGSRMASRLLDAGFEVAVWNRTTSSCVPLQAKGAMLITNLPMHHQALADNGSHPISNVQVIALCLSDDAAVQTVAHQLLPTLQHGQIVVDFSSLSYHLTRTLAAQAQAQGVVWIDAPVSGGVMGAEQGTLVVFAGGDAPTVSQLGKFFAPLAQRVTYMGGSGAGQVTKICNQLIVASNSTIIAEAIALANKAGIDASQLAPALAGGFADSKPLQILAPRMASQTFTPVQWKVKTLHKDLNNAAELAQQCGVTLPVTAMAQMQLQQYIQAGGAEEDLSSIIKLPR